jgi:hypothetical protein
MSKKSSKKVPEDTRRTIRFPVSGLTPANLSYIQNGMQEGDSLEFKFEGGRLVPQIKTSGGDLNAASLEHRVNFALGLEPVKPSWMGFTSELPEKVHPAVRAKRAAGERKIKEKTGLKSALKAAFSMALFFMTLEDAIQEVSGSEKLLEFKIGVYRVFTTLGMSPVSYSDEGGEIVYL